MTNPQARSEGVRKEAVCVEKVLSMSGDLRRVPFRGRGTVLLISASSTRRLVFSQVHVSGEESVSLCSSCFYKVHQTGRLAHPRSVILTALEAGRPLGVPAQSSFGEGLLSGYKQPSPWRLLPRQRAEGGEASSPESVLRALIRSPRPQYLHTGGYDFSLRTCRKGTQTFSP